MIRMLTKSARLKALIDAVVRALSPVACVAFDGCATPIPVGAVEENVAELHPGMLRLLLLLINLTFVRRTWLRRRAMGALTK